MRLVFRIVPFVTALCAFGILIAFPAAPQAKRQIAVTFDDLIFVPHDDLQRASEWTKKLTTTLKQNKVPVTAFVNEIKLKPAPESDARTAVLKVWLDAGIDLGNHTYSHVDMFTSNPEIFEKELVSGEQVTRKLMVAKGKTEKYFRHPFLNTGPNTETKAAYGRILAAHHYLVAPVTVDNADYMFAKVYTEALRNNDLQLQKRVVDAYIPYMDSMLDFYEKQSKSLLGRELRQVLLVHANPLNAEHFGEMIEMMRKRGYTFISLDEALKDPAYQQREDFVSRSGISWIQRWAITSKDKATIAGFKDEPTIPGFIEEGYKRK